ncbi:MAG: hypothetical protein JWO02_3756 [Solirubrobacterales bacterium]|nr:hypothetical protein [Solirubrobacterales bacterium]
MMMSSVECRVSSVECRAERVLARVLEHRLGGPVVVADDATGIGHDDGVVGDRQEARLVRPNAGLLSVAVAVAVA